MRDAIKQIIPDAWNMGTPPAREEDRIEEPWKGISPQGQEHIIDVVHKTLNRLPAEISEEWKPCRFHDIEGTDEAVMFAFEDGSIIQGVLHERTFTKVRLWVGASVHEVPASDCKPRNVKIYRKPEKISLPDPSCNLIISDTTDETIWFADSGVYSNPHKATFKQPEDFGNNWKRARIVVEDA